MGTTKAQRGLDLAELVEGIGQRPQGYSNLARCRVNVPTTADVASHLVGQFQDDPGRAVQLARAEIECEVVTYDHYEIRCIDRAET